jgi:hypothetical protein
MPCPYENPEYLTDIADRASARFDSERKRVACKCPGAEELNLREINAVQYATIKELICRFCNGLAPSCKNDSDFFPEPA